LSASAIGYYGIHGDEVLDERAAPQPIFQSQLCQQWEAAAQAADDLGVRLVTLRLGLVLARHGGALPSMALPVRLGVGAIIGTGRQWVSWIHIDDAVRLIEFALGNLGLRGAVNAVAPTPLSHDAFQRELARTLRRPVWLCIPAWVLRNTLGEMAQLLLDGQRVVPHRAVTAGFVFQYSESGAALRQLLGSSPLKSVLRRQSVYYNGACPVCRTEMNHYARRCEAAAAPVTFVDSSVQYDALLEYGLRPEHLKRRVYLKSANGQVLSGVAALASLWAQTPGYGWLSKLVSLPFLRSVAEALYDYIAVPVLVALESWRRAEPAHHGRILGS
jgi:predicted DCC family thiol-disulfide oxidoreductase YuxK